MRYDIIVIGGGPAGLSAAVQARIRNKSVLVAGGDDRDGALAKAVHVDNYLGLPGLSGEELMARFRAHAEAMGVVRSKGRALQILPMGGGFVVGIGTEAEEAGAVILATGAAPARKFPGEAEFLGRGVSWCATCDGALYRQRDIVVVGLSAAAPGEAVFLQELGCRVTYVAARRPEELPQTIPFAAGVRLEVVGGRTVTGLRTESGEIPCAGVFILRPTLALSDLLPGLELEGGYLAVNRDMAATLPGVFAAGDCTGPPLQISKAVGQGLIAGQRAAEYLDRDPFS